MSKTSHTFYKPQSLIRKSMKHFIACIAILFVLAAPVFYWLTKNYYAEDMIDLIEALQAGKNIPEPDLEEDILTGIMLQYLLITALLCMGIVLMVRFVSQKLWKPFDQTLNCIDDFRLEDEAVPVLPDSDIAEFEKLNEALRQLMAKSVRSYQAQKEFTENASHELQTPLAIFQTKLELLLQQPNLTHEQAQIIQDLFQMTSRLSRLNHDLLFLAKIDNAQFDAMENIRLATFIDNMLPSLESIVGQQRIERHDCSHPVTINANRTLLESMVSNLIVNAVRHSDTNGLIDISVSDHQLTISNTSDEPALPSSHIFNRFYLPLQNKSGNGLGLAIVKSVCNYHGWNIEYRFHDKRHYFTVDFLVS